MTRPIPPGYMTAETLLAKIYTHIDIRTTEWKQEVKSKKSNRTSVVTAHV